MALATRVRRTTRTNEAADSAVMTLRRKIDSVMAKRARAAALLIESDELESSLRSQMEQMNLSELTGIESEALAHWITPEGRASRSVDPVAYFNACQDMAMKPDTILTTMSVTIKSAEANLPGKAMEKIVTVTPAEAKEPVFKVEQPKQAKKGRK